MSFSFIDRSNPQASYDSLVKQADRSEQNRRQRILSFNAKLRPQVSRTEQIKPIVDRSMTHLDFLTVPVPFLGTSIDDESV